MNGNARERHIEVYQVDVFTSCPFSGNPAGVVPGADDLSEAQMSAIAREMNLSETAFLLSPTDNSHDIHIRYFTPSTEVPSCGHATIAAHIVNAVRCGLDTCNLRTRTGAGVLSVDVLRDNDDYRVRMTQAEPQFGPPLDDAVVTEIGAALRMPPGTLRNDVPVQVVSTGHSKIIIPFQRREDIDALQPDNGALAALSARIGSNGFFPFALDAPRGALSYGRMFAPAIGIAEDPVTGNANGPLGAYLVKHRLVDAPESGRYVFTAAQGDVVNRPGQMQVEVDIANALPVRVAIVGSAVIMFKAKLRIA